MKVKVLLCNCKGLCPSFKDADMNTLPFQLESDMDIQYSVLHPQLCGQGGSAVLTELLREAAPDPENYVVSGACAPKAQYKLFKKVVRNAGFDETTSVRGTGRAWTFVTFPDKEELRQTLRRLRAEARQEPAFPDPVVS